MQMNISNKSRRNLLKSLVAGGAAMSVKTMPESWTKPVVNAVILPAHAQSTPSVAGSSPTWITPSGSLGADFTERLSSFAVNAVTGAGTRPVSYAVLSGSLPGGMSIDSSTGEINGIATGVSDFSSTVFDFTVRATNTVGRSADRAFSITIASRYVGFQSVEVLEGGVASDTAPVGSVFNRTDFSSYGTPTGTSGSYAIGSCNSVSSNSYDPTPTPSYSTPANNATWGDPCFGTFKRMYIQMSYGPF